MKGIIFDLETQRLRKEVQGALMEIMWFDNKPEFIQFDPDLRTMRQVRPQERTAVLKKIYSKGPLQLAPWMQTSLKIDKPIDGLEKAIEAAWQVVGGSVYYDPKYHELDVQRECDGKWDVLHRHLSLSVAVTWDEANGYREWWEQQAPDLVDELARFPFIVGSNLIGFDYTVLERYVSDVRKRLGFKTIDLLAHARWGLFLAWLDRKLGSEKPVTRRRIQLALTQARRSVPNKRGSKAIFFEREPYKYEWENIAPWSKRDIHIPRYRVSLQALAKGTLGESKMGKATDAPTLFAEGKLDKLVEYCQKDVELTRAVFQIGCDRGAVEIKDLAIPVRWDELGRRLVKRTRRKKGPVWEDACLKFQYALLINTSPLTDIERLFRLWDRVGDQHRT